MVVMLHSINQGKAEGQGAISETDFARLMAGLHDQKFSAINMMQLADFLKSNAKISRPIGGADPGWKAVRREF